jgi:DNA-binding transcriptional LysR family regulator
VSIRKSGGPPLPPSDPAEPEWSDLRFFLAIAEAGSISKAAQRLGSTQPTLSKRLDDLEVRMGVTLAVRSLNGIALTEEGRVVAEHAAMMGRAVRRMTKSVGMRDKAAAGNVTIVCPDALATYLIAPALAEFQRAWPGITLELRSRTDPDTAPDLSIQFRETKRMDDVAVSLGWQHYAAFASREYLDLYPAPTAMTDAFQHKVLVSLEHVEQSERWHDKARAMQDMLDPAMTSDCGTVMIKAVCAGAGVAALPTYLAHFEPELVLLDTGEYARARFWLVFDHESGESVRVRKTIDWIREIFAPAKNPWFWEEYVEPGEFAAALER